MSLVCQRFPTEHVPYVLPLVLKVVVEHLVNR